MASPRDILRYTERWLDLFDKFQDDPAQEHIVYCDSPAHAKLVRLEFYKAREAMKRHEEKLKKDDPKTYAEIGHPNLDRKEVRIVGNNCVFGFKDDSVIAKLLEKSLADPRNNAPKEGHQ